MGLAIGRKIAIGMTGLGSNVNQNEPPVLSGLSVTNVADTSVNVVVTVDPKSLNTVVVVHFGKTATYDRTRMYSVPVTESGEITIPVTGLDDYTEYYFKVVATNVGGSTELVGVNFTTLVPSELSDGNWYQKFEFNHASNVVDGSNLMSQLRDLNQNTESAELYQNGTFDDATGWTLGTGWSIAGGKLVAASGGASANATKAVGYLNSVFKLRYQLAGTSFNITQTGIAPSTSRTTPGSFEQIGIGAGVNLGLRKTASSVVDVDNAECYKILGNHMVQRTPGIEPLKETNYLSFNGSSQYLISPIDNTLSGAKGTIYAIAQRVGTDADFVVRNDLTGLGGFGNYLMTLGSSFNQSVYYNIRLKMMYHRTVVDDVNTTRRLNNYFAKIYGVDHYIAYSDIQTVTAPVVGQSRAFVGMTFVGERIYLFYRYSEIGGHNGFNGIIIEKHSDDYGYTWSDELQVYDASEMATDHPEIFTAHPEAQVDARDSRCVVTDDNHLLLMSFVSFGYMTGDIALGTRNEYNLNIVVAHRVPILTDGSLDWANKTKTEVASGVNYGGGILKKDGVIFISTYYNTKLYKSDDNGLTWDYISQLTTLGSEAAFTYVGDTLYAPVRPNDSNQVGGILCVSTDDGETWTEDVLPQQMHGHSAVTLESGNWLVFGRLTGDDPKGSAFYLLSGTFANSLRYIIMERTAGASSDSGYGTVLFKDGFYYFGWYNATVYKLDSGIYFTRLKEADVEALALT